MKLLNAMRLGLLAGAFLSAGAFASTGGGATIHNAATLTFNGGSKVTDWVDVGVLTTGTDPLITFTGPASATLNAGESVTLNYTIVGQSNGSDSYSLATVDSVETGLAPGTTYSLSTNTVTLGASITSAPSAIVDGDTGTVFIPAGSETNLSVGDTVVIGGFEYLIEAVRPGTVASTLGNTTTPETYTEVDLTVPLASGSPSIGNATVGTGVQLGELGTFTVDVTVAAPTTPGTDGTVDVVISGNTSALNTSGNPEDFTTAGGSTTDDAEITVLSAEVTILKEALNVTKGETVYQTSGVNAQSGDVLEYRIVMEATSGSGDATTSILADELPQYTDYCQGSTTLNGSPVTDDNTGDDASGTSVTGCDYDEATFNNNLPLAAVNGGLGVNSATGAADQANGGTLVDGDTGLNAATVIFRVRVK